MRCSGEQLVTMPLSLRSVLSLSLSGAMALVGLWWYVSRRRSAHANRDAQGGKASGKRSAASDDGIGRKEEKGSVEEQRGIGGTNKTVAERARMDVDTAAAIATGTSAADPFPVAAAETTDCKEAGPAEASLRKDPPSSVEGRLSTRGPLSDGAGDGPPSPAHARSPDVPGVTEEKRPDPEGEVGGGDMAESKMAVRFADSLPQSDLSEDCTVSGETVSPVEAEPVCASDLRRPPAAPSPGYAGAKEMQQLAEGLISNMVSAAVAEVLQARTGRTLSEQAGDVRADDGETQGRTRTCASPTADRKSAASPVAQEDCSGTDTRRAGTHPQLIDEDDSSTTSSDQAEDSSGDEDDRVACRPGMEVPEDSENLEKRSKTTRGQLEILSNGHGKQEERRGQDHRVTSVTRHCEQGAADLQSSSLQPPAQTSELRAIWEFEVPKHLVGRMIGKQGRYVSYLEATSGATVFISAVPYTQEVQVCHLEGTTGQVEVALALIRRKFKDLELTNCYAQPPVLSLPALPITSWLLLPHGVTVEVQVVQVASGNYLFLQQHTHPTFQALRVLDQQMRLCYAHPGCPSLPAPVEVGVICAAQMPEGAWWRAQVMRFNEENRELEIRYVDYGGYHTVSIDNLRQIRSDFVSLPFQGSEVILENLAPLSGEEDFSAAAKSALEDLTQGVSLLAQVTEFHSSGIPLVQLWRKEENQLVSVNQALVERGVCSWINRP